jgi:hypothetical protein
MTPSSDSTLFITALSGVAWLQHDLRVCLGPRNDFPVISHATHPCRKHSISLTPFLILLQNQDRGCAELVDALDMVLDPSSPIFAFCRDINRQSYEAAVDLHNECVRIWREGGGPQKRVTLLDQAPWRSLVFFPTQEVALTCDAPPTPSH